MRTDMEMDPALTPLKRFWMLLKPDQADIKSIYAYAIFIGLLNLSLPLGIQAIINLIQGGAVSTSWIILVLLVVTGIALGGIMQIAQLRIIENIQQKIFIRAAFEFVYRIPRLRLDKLARHYAPELMNRFFDIVSVQKGLSKILVDFSAAIMQVFFGLILLSLYHPFFILFSLMLVVIVYVIIRFTARKGLETSLQESKYKYTIAHWLEELARGKTTFKLAGKTTLPLEKMNERAEKYIFARDAHFSVLLKQFSVMIVFKVFVALGLLLIGGLLVIEQQMNLGQFVAAELIILLVINSVEKLVLSFETVYDVLTSLEKIGQVTDMELDSEGGLIISREKKGGQIDLKDLCFRYEEGTKEILKGVSLSIKSGERIMITGKNDGGKSTLLYLIAGIYQPSSGVICMDEIPYQNFDKEDVHSVIGGYLQDDILFEGTLLENITIGRENTPFEQVQWAVSNLGLLEFVQQLPAGFDTLLLPQGSQLSKSVIAKILLARAIVNKPRILMVDNSFSIFTHSDRIAIQRFILNDKHPWTVIFADSESSEVSSLMDREIVLEGGRIVQ